MPIYKGSPVSTRESQSAGRVKSSQPISGTFVHWQSVLTYRKLQLIAFGAQSSASNNDLETADYFVLNSLNSCMHNLRAYEHGNINKFVIYGSGVSLKVYPNASCLKTPRCRVGGGWEREWGIGCVEGCSSLSTGMGSGKGTEGIRMFLDFQVKMKGFMHWKFSIGVQHFYVTPTVTLQALDIYHNFMHL